MIINDDHDDIMWNTIIIKSYDVDKEEHDNDTFCHVSNKVVLAMIKDKEGQWG